MKNHVMPNVETNGRLRIVVATDLQPRSERALSRAISLANGIGATLTVVHAVPKTPSTPSARVRRNAVYAQILSAIDDATAGTRSELIDIDVRVGKPLDVIATAARAANADLIVVAAPLARRFDSIVGTTAERLIRATQRPVLIVHREAHNDYINAAVASDLSAGSVSIIQTAARFGIFDSKQTTLLHAFDPPYAGMLKSVGVDDAGINDYYSSWREELETNARVTLDAAGLPDDDARVAVRPQHVAEAIRELLEQEKPEVLVIGASRWFLTKRLLVGSVADQVLRTASCDVLVIPRKFEKGYISRLRHTSPAKRQPGLSTPHTAHAQSAANTKMAAP
jgi:universal stress protein E